MKNSLHKLDLLSNKLSYLLKRFFNIYFFRSTVFNNVYPLPDFFTLWNYLTVEQQNRISGYLNFSYAQGFQDLLALALYEGKNEGYFVEFGACDGILYSNTYLLENKLNWNGIVSEPARIWHEALQKNRNCTIETKCVWKKSGEIILFDEVQKIDQQIAPQISSVSNLKNNDWAGKIRSKNSIKYSVETISLLDLLQKNSAPRTIDFLSIDTEGSEFLILENFDFEKYNFGLISVEHNYTKNRSKIYNLLKKKGYQRILKNISGADDFYVPQFV